MSNQTEADDEAQEIAPVEAARMLAGRELSSEEIARFYCVKEQLGLSDNDSIWTILLAFGHYEILYEGIPAKIKESLTSILAEAKISLSYAADAAERTMIARIEKDAAAAVQKLAEQARNNAQTASASVAKQRMMIWAGFASVIAFVAAGTLLWAGYHLGVRSNAAELAWLHTADGKAAKRFATLNNVERMLECPAPQSIQNRGDGDYCNPYETTTKTVRMWRIK